MLPQQKRASSLLWCMLVAVPGAGHGKGGQGSGGRSGRAHATWSLERNMLTALMGVENGIGCDRAVNPSCVSHDGRDGCDVTTAVL